MSSIVTALIPDFEKCSIAISKMRVRVTVNPLKIQAVEIMETIKIIKVSEGY